MTLEFPFTDRELLQARNSAATHLYVVRRMIEMYEDHPQPCGWCFEANATGTLEDDEG